MNIHEDNVTLIINGKVYNVDGHSVTPQTSLNTFIRDHAMLKGTKYMCKEGGCGACIVALLSTHPNTKKDHYYAVNSCLVPVLSCHGSAVVTVEGIGSKQKGYHKIQQTLASYNGTQCGYCSPGMVMNMYSLLKGKPSVTMDEVENSFGGQTCRCTGYRPILDAFKSFAKDAPTPPKTDVDDIEDALNKCKIAGCQKRCSQCPRKIFESEDEFDEEIAFAETALAPRSFHMRFSNSTNWYRVQSVKEVMEIMDMIGDNSYAFVAGNTAQGVYRSEPKTYYIDIKGIADLRSSQMTSNCLEIGANVTLKEAMDFFVQTASKNPLLFGYAKELADHIDLVANVAVRNIGTLAGNLSIKHQHPDFPSDIFILMATAGATLTICEPSGTVAQVSMMEYLRTDMNKKLIVKISLPAISSRHYIMKTYKILPRKQNAPAVVNAGFLFRIMNPRVLVEEKPKILFGGISGSMVNAEQAETFLAGKELLKQGVLKNVISILSKELKPTGDSSKSSSEYRNRLACSLLYKFMLNVCHAKVNRRFLTGGELLHRPLSSGVQDYEAHDKSKPAGVPVQKLESLIQCSGEAEYVNDIPQTFGELYGALVITDRAVADLKGVNAKKALAMAGVVSFFSAKDIPGKNSFVTVAPPLMVEHEELFCSGKVQFAGQPVGMIVAVTQEIAIKAADLVQITYTNETKPVLTIKDVLQKQDSARIIPQTNMNPTKAPGKIDYKLAGELELGGQYHYTMELQSCLVVPNDLGLKVYPATQWMQFTQSAIARMLDVSDN